MNQNDTVKNSFKKQAKKFAAYHMSKTEYTDYLMKRIGEKGTEHALEVAAGTCICGRVLAPFVKDITCLDLTEEMLAQGKRLAGENQINNIYFQTGNAEELPYDSETFNLVVWDMEAAEESLRTMDDKIENMRDPSHTRILSRKEFEKLFEKDFELQCEETTLVPVNLNSWLELTDTPEDVQKEITDLMKAELAGGSKTGFSPYNKESQIMFDHRWLLLIGKKIKGNRNKQEDPL